MKKDPIIPSGYSSEEMQNIALKGHVHPNAHCRIINNSQDMKAT